MEKLLTILTPTYNRANKISDLYISLLKQTNHNFNWLIIDDGSSDETKEVVNKFDKTRFNISYYYKKNGGKHTAHNMGLNYVETELTMVVDSDDFLTKDAVQLVYDKWIPVRDENLCGLSFLKSNKSGEVSGIEFPEKEFIGNFIDIRINRGDISEKAEIWVTSILKEYPFPVFQDEKYVAEGSIWSTIAKKYDMLFVNKVIYVYEYDEDGLTFAGRKLRIDNPLGGIFTSKVALSKEFNMKTKMKKMVLYICYGFFANIKITDMYNNSPLKVLYILLLPFGGTAFLVWKKIYR